MARDTASIGRRVPRLNPFQGRGQMRHVSRHGLWRSIAIQELLGKVIKLLLRKQRDLGFTKFVIPDILDILLGRLAKFFAPFQPIGNYVCDRGVGSDLHRETVQLDLGQLFVPPFLCICQVPESFAETAGLPIHLASDLDPVFCTATSGLNAGNVPFFEIVSLFRLLGLGFLVGFGRGGGNALSWQRGGCWIRNLLPSRGTLTAGGLLRGNSGQDVLGAVIDGGHGNVSFFAVVRRKSVHSGAGNPEFESRLPWVGHRAKGGGARGESERSMRRCSGSADVLHGSNPGSKTSENRRKSTPSVLHESHSEIRLSC